MAGMALPPFTSDGVLPVGDYDLTLQELRASCLVTGQGLASEAWDAAWRAYLVDNLGILADQLWRLGFPHVFVNGSFVEDKDHPNDIDGYFECPLARIVSGDLVRDLNQLDPHSAWTWDLSSR